MKKHFKLRPAAASAQAQSPSQPKAGALYGELVHASIKVADSVTVSADYMHHDYRNGVSVGMRAGF